MSIFNNLPIVKNLRQALKSAEITASEYFKKAQDLGEKLETALDNIKHLETSVRSYKDLLAGLREENEALKTKCATIALDVKEAVEVMSKIDRNIVNKNVMTEIKEFVEKFKD